MRRDDIMETIREVMGVILVTAAVFAWIMAVLLILSFVALSYFSMNIKTMVIVGIIGAVIVDVFYIRGRIIKRKKRRGT